MPSIVGRIAAVPSSPEYAVIAPSPPFASNVKTSIAVDVHCANNSIELTGTYEDPPTPTSVPPTSALNHPSNVLLLNVGVGRISAAVPTTKLDEPTIATPPPYEYVTEYVSGDH